MKTLNLLSFLCLMAATITLLTSCATANRQPDTKLSDRVKVISIWIHNGQYEVICYGQPVDSVSSPIPCGE